MLLVCLLGFCGYVFFMLMLMYSEYNEYKDNVKEEVWHDYDNLIRYCKRDTVTLKWATTLNKRFKKFMMSTEYLNRKPYDKFRLIIPYKIQCPLIAFIAVDKNLNLKFVINFEPSAHDDGKTDLYLKYCVGYGKEIDDFIKKCENTVLSYKLENKRIKTVENIINN